MIHMGQFYIRLDEANSTTILTHATADFYACIKI